MQRDARKSVRCNLDHIQCLRMFEGRNPPGDATKSCAQFSSSGMHSSRASAHGCRPGRPMRRNYSDDFLVPVEGVSLILSRVYASTLHLISFICIKDDQLPLLCVRPSFPTLASQSLSYSFSSFFFLNLHRRSILRLQTKCLHIAIWSGLSMDSW